MLQLKTDCVRLFAAASNNGNGTIYGELTIKRGLKRRARKRMLAVTAEMKGVLARLLKESACDWVFTNPHDPAKALPAWIIESQMAQVRKKSEFHPDAGLHALRHTFLTEAGQHTDPFTLQYVAGHDNIKTTMRYVHPQAEAVESLFGRLGNLKRSHTSVGAKTGSTGSAQKPAQPREGRRSAQKPAHGLSALELQLNKSFDLSSLQNAEVVELADTPS